MESSESAFGPKTNFSVETSPQPRKKSEVIPTSVAWQGEGIIPEGHPDRVIALDRLHFIESKIYALREDIDLLSEGAKLIRKEASEKAPTLAQRYKRLVGREEPKLRPEEVEKITTALQAYQTELAALAAEEVVLERVLFDAAALEKRRFQKNDWETPATVDPEKINQEFKPFINSFFEGPVLPNERLPEFVPIITSPRHEDYLEKKEDVELARSGEYTINPEMLDVDFEHAKVLILDIADPAHSEAYNYNKSLHGRDNSAADTLEYIAHTYGYSHYLPGLEYLKWLTENPAKAPARLKGGSLHELPGSLVRGSHGHWQMLVFRWNFQTENFNISMGQLSSSPLGLRLVLLEK